MFHLLFSVYDYIIRPWRFSWQCHQWNQPCWAWSFLPNSLTSNPQEILQQYPDYVSLDFHRCRLPTSIGLPITCQHYQPALGSLRSRDYLIQPKNLKFGLWKLTSTDVFHLTPHVLKDSIISQSGFIMGNWDLCDPSNCIDSCSLTVLKGCCLFNGTYLHRKYTNK